MANKRDSIGRKTTVPTNEKIIKGDYFNDFPKGARDGGMRLDYELSLGDEKTTIPASEHIAAGRSFDDSKAVKHEGERGFVTHKRPGESFSMAHGRK